MIRLTWDELTFASYVASIGAAPPANMRASTATVARDLSQVACNVHTRKQLIDEVSRFYDGTCADTLSNAHREALHLWDLFSTWCKVHAEPQDEDLPANVANFAKWSSRRGGGIVSLVEAADVNLRLDERPNAVKRP